jgi:hypothetical protein
MLGLISFYMLIFMGAMLYHFYLINFLAGLTIDCIALLGLVCFVGQQFTIDTTSLWADGRHRISVTRNKKPAGRKYIIRHPCCNFRPRAGITHFECAISTTHLINRLLLGNVLFFADQAMKGLLVDVVTVFNINIQTQLHLDAWRHPVFGLFLVAFRLVMSFLTLSILPQAWRRWFSL